MDNFMNRGHRFLGRIAVGAALASFGFVGLANADTDGIVLTSKVPVPAVSSAGLPGCTGFTPTSFSFDISWVDPFVRAYFLADRTHGGAANGDVMMIDLNSISINSPNTLNQGTTYLTPPAGDPFAGIRCDANAAFGGTTGAGRNEITGPNGLFTVNHAEVWVGDAPTFSGPIGQTNSAVDYKFDNCDSNVRVFDIASGKQTDHINVGGCFRTDEGAFDGDDQVALFANPSEQHIGFENFAHPFITLISTIPVPTGKHHKILKQIQFDGHHGTVLADGGIEQAVYSHKTGMFYVAVPGNSAAPNNGFVAVVDPRGDADDIRVVANFHVTNCSPNGAALGPDFELFLGCSAGPEQVIDIRNGHLIKVLTGTTGGCDEVAFNAGDDHFVGACTDSNADSSDNLDISDADRANFDHALDTFTKGAHSVTSDPVTVSDFVPATLVGPANPSAACGATPCVLIYSSTGGDDPSVFAQERAEDRKDRD